MYSPGFIVVKFDHFGINPVFKPIEFDGFRKYDGLNTIAIPHPAGGELQESALKNKDFT